MLSFCSGLCAPAGTAEQSANARAMRTKLIPSPLYQVVKPLAGAGRLRLPCPEFFPYTEFTHEASLVPRRVRPVRRAASALGRARHRTRHLRLGPPRRLADTGKAHGHAQGKGLAGETHQGGRRLLRGVRPQRKGRARGSVFPSAHPCPGSNRFQGPQGLSNEVRVWDPLLRIAHWTLVAAVLATWITSEMKLDAPKRAHERLGYA